MKKLLPLIALFISSASFGQVRLVFDFSVYSSALPDTDVCLYFVNGNKIYLSAKTGSTQRRYFYSSTGATTLSANPQLNFYTDQTTLTNTTCTYNNAVYFGAFDAAIGYIFRIEAPSTPSNLFNLDNSSGNANSPRLGYPSVVNDKLIFAHVNVGSSTNYGDEPYLYNLTNSAASGLLLDIVPGVSSSIPKEFTTLGTNCFFSADNVTNGRELWKTDGTLAGTTLYLDMITGSTSSNPSDLNVVGTQLTFVATHPTLGRELFRTNGVGSLTLIKDINTSGDSNPTNVTTIGDKLYFSASNGANNQEPYFSSGVNLLSTSNIKDINAAGSSNPAKFTQLPSIPSLIVFTANDGLHGVELWITDGTPANTYMLKDINPTGDSNPDEFTAYNGKLYFTADDGVNGKQLWVTDGSGLATGTSKIQINPTTSSRISHLMVLGDELYFAADVGTGAGKELYAYKDPALATNHFTLNENAITLSPNPSKDYFNLTTELTIEKVEVYSILGQLVKTFDRQDQYKIPGLAKGTYIVKVNAAEGAISKTLFLE